MASRIRTAFGDLHRLSGDDWVPPQPDVVRGFTGAPKADLSAQKRLVTSVLPGWTGIDIDLIEIEDKSGRGGSKTFKVFSEDAKPPAVALHSRATVREDTTPHHAFVDQLTEDRQEAAAREFSAAGVAPRRLAQGGDWFIEPWEGEQPWNGEGCTWNTVEHLQAAAELMARVHKDVPVSWYDEWRPKIIERIPAMSEASLGSHAWRAACRMQWFEGEGAHLQDVIRYYVTAGNAPEFPLAARIVTLHGDFHPGNYIQTKEDGLLCVDLEFSHVGYAIGDVAYALYWMPQDRHRLFIEAYMKASGIPKPSSEEIDAFYFEAELCRHAILFRDFQSSKSDPTYNFRRYRLVDDIKKRARTELALRAQIIEKGFTKIHKTMEIEMEVGPMLEKGTDFSKYERLVSDGRVDQCWWVKTGEGDFCVQVNLADQNYARFTFDGSHCLGQGQFTMQQGIYAESSRENAKGELQGDQADFHIMLDNDHYVPVAENVFPWALPLTRKELKKDLFLGHFDELSGNDDSTNCGT